MKQEKGHMFFQEGEVSNIEEQNNVTGQTVGNVTNGNDNSEVIIRCTRCGAEMKNGARYCMKCGNLNYTHQENKFMKQNAIDNIKYKDYVGGLETARINGMEVPKEAVFYPFRACLKTNIILFVIFTLLAIGGVVAVGNVNAGILIGIVLYFGVSFFLAYSYQRMLIKARENWWSFFIPIYNIYIYFKVAFGKGWFFLLTLIPIVGFIISIVATYKLADKFYKNGWLMIFFPYVMIPIIAFDKEAIFKVEDEISLKKYHNIVSDGYTKSSMEKSYRAKKTLFSIIVLIGFGITVYLGWDYIKMIYEFILEQYEATKNILIK